VHKRRHTPTIPMHMYNYVYMHIGKYTGYANTPEIKHGEKGDRRKTKWTCSHHWNEVSEWSSVRPFTFSACSLVWGVFTTNGLSFAMQLLDLHFLTMSKWLCQLAFRAWCSGVVPPHHKGWEGGPKEKRLWRWSCCLFSFLNPPQPHPWEDNGHVEKEMDWVHEEHGKLCVETQGWKHSVKNSLWKMNYATEQMICMMLPSTRFCT
jgi:hypothetical protein